MRTLLPGGPTASVTAAATTPCRRLQRTDEMGEVRIGNQRSSWPRYATYSPRANSRPALFGSGLTAAVRLQIRPPCPPIREGARDLLRVVGAAVADDKELQIPVRLRERRCDGVSEHGAPVVGRHDHAHERLPGESGPDIRVPQHACDLPTDARGALPLLPGHGRTGIRSESTGRRYLSGSSWSYGRVGRLTNTTSSEPTFRTAW